MIFLKIGGGLITDKKVPFSVKWDIVNRICREISEIDEKMVIGHGGGSFGHFVARDYRGMLVGFPKIREAMMKLNLILTSSLLAFGVNAVTFPPSSFMITRNGDVESMYVEPIKEALEKDIVPVVHGDAVLDREIGYVIFSTERIFRELAGYIKPRKVLIASDSPVWVEGEMVKEINDVNANDDIVRLDYSEYRESSCRSA